MDQLGLESLLGSDDSNGLSATSNETTSKSAHLVLFVGEYVGGCEFIGREPD